MTQTHSLDDYLNVLAETSPANGPFKSEELGEGGAAEMNAAFADFAHAAVTFVQTVEPVVGYTETRRLLEDFVHTFPANKEPNPFALIAAMFGLSPEDFVTISLEDGEDEDAEEGTPAP